MAEGFPARGVAIIDALLGLFPALAKGSDEERRSLTSFIAEQMCFELGSGWGTKRADANRPLSKDAIAFRNADNTIEIWDWQNGTTRARQVQAGAPPTESHSRQVFVAVPPVDHLGVVGRPPDSPGPPVLEPDDEFARLIDEAALRICSAIGELVDTLEKLDARLGEIQEAGVRFRLR